MKETIRVAFPAITIAIWPRRLAIYLGTVSSKYAIHQQVKGNCRFPPTCKPQGDTTIPDNLTCSCIWCPQIKGDNRVKKKESNIDALRCTVHRKGTFPDPLRPCRESTAGAIPGCLCPGTDPGADPNGCPTATQRELRSIHIFSLPSTTPSQRMMWVLKDSRCVFRRNVERKVLDP